MYTYRYTYIVCIYIYVLHYVTHTYIYNSIYMYKLSYTHIFNYAILGLPDPTSIPKRTPPGL